MVRIPAFNVHLRLLYSQPLSLLYFTTFKNTSLKRRECTLISTSPPTSFYSAECQASNKVEDEP